MEEKGYYLRRIHLVITSESPEISSEGTTGEMSFVYGVASAGISPFEKDLAAYMPDESFSLEVSRQQAPLYFDYLLGELTGALRLPIFPSTLKLRVSFQGVEEAKPREVVQAMVKANQDHGCGGSCGCGCGE